MGVLNADALLKQYSKYCSSIIIPSKDEGLVPYKPFGTQIYLREQLIRGIGEGIHEFVIVKPRQVGASTEMWAFDTFWLQRWPGLQGAMIAESDKNTQTARFTIVNLLKGLEPKYRIPLSLDNRVMTAWMAFERNGKRLGGSRLAYLTAGTKENKSLGRSRGLSYAHGTEVAYWGDPDGFGALRSGLSEHHPYRCYVWESTANGYNWYYDLWCDAQRAVTMRPIFIPWWRHELYSVEKKTKIYQVYWDGKLTSDERAWEREIDRRWETRIAPEQWAWYRYKLSEGKGGDELRMHEDYPTLPEHAFQASGQGFLGANAMAKLREDHASIPKPTFYRYTFGPLIEDCRLHVTTEAMAQLTVWEEPREKCHYLISADPSYAASPKSDQAVCQVWRAERTQLVQVAEFSANDVPIHQFAWICLHMLGVYQRAYFNLELSGPGYGVWQEIQRVESWGAGSAKRPEIQSVLGGVQHYIYRRADSVGSGSGAWHTQMTPRVKAWMMTRLRDHLLRESIQIRSKELIEELNSFKQDGDSYGAVGGAHDDRVMAMALACEQWTEQVMPILYMSPDPLTEAERIKGLRDPMQDPDPVHEHVVKQFFERLGVK